VRAPGVLHGHEVRDLGDPFRVEEAGEQHVRVGEIELFARRPVEDGRDLEAASPLGIEKSGEDGGGVELGEAEEVDGGVHPHQRHRVQIPDEPVLGQGCVAIGH
jgi:hypothetical protein